MKKDTHPSNYRPVLFVDASTHTQFLIWSTVETKDAGKYEKDGKEYPLYRVEISSASHPFYTGKESLLDTTGRVDRFKKLQEKSKSKAAKKK
jgi:large subunit ribosomal protein L31